MICLTGVAQSFIFDSPKRQVCLGPSHHSLALFARRSRCFDIVSIRVKGEVSEVMPSVFLFGYQCRVDMMHRESEVMPSVFLFGYQCRVDMMRRESEVIPSVFLFGYQCRVDMMDRESEVMPTVFLFGYQCRVDMLHRVIKKSSLTSVVSASEELGSLSRECEVPGEVNSGLPYSQSFFSQSKCHSQFPARKSRTVAAMSSSQAKA